MDERVLKQLYETFKLSERKGTGGMTFKYVPNEDVIDRMNKVFKGDWCTRVKDKDVVDDQVFIEVQVDVYSDGRCFTQTGFGSQQIMRYTQGPNAGKIIDIGNAYKGALAKSIVNACTRWGVGLFKERNPYKLDNVNMVADDSTSIGVAPVRQPSPRPSNLPPVSTPTPMPPVKEPAPAKELAPTPVATSAPAPMPPVAPQPVVQQPAPVNASSYTPQSSVPQFNAVAPAPLTPETAPAAPTVETTVHNPAPPMPNQPISASLNVKQEPVMPNFPAPNMAPATDAPQTPELPMSKSNGNDLSSVGITDVQRVALNGILSMHKAEYAELAREAFDSKGMNQPIPPKEQLSYQEAVVVIKYGNDKFKKNR